MYTYDSLGRKTRDAYITPTQFGSNGYYVDYTYTDGAGGSTTTKVSSVNFLHKGRTINYNYDSKGNIDTITDNNKKIKYYYNELNEVTREDNQVLNKTIVYTYDAGGNILTKTEYNYTTDANPSNPVNTYNYAYGDSNWKDKLTSYNGKTITYDAIGNPLTYDGWTFTWEEGRQLSSMSKTGTNISYKYNDKGIRTEKSVNGVVTKYHLNGDDVTYEDNGTDKIYYTYDSSGKLISMNLNGTEYYYTRNAQGDIIGLFDTNGNDVVSYTYDTWGKVVSIDGSLKDTVGVKNPYRYRGYRFDTETGLYYLNARYYNPELGRFINADSIGGKVGELLSHNVFAYCTNNHVNLKDSNGNWPTLTDIWNGIKNSWNYVSKQVQVSVKIAIVTIAVAVGVKYIENKVVSRKNFKSKSNAGWDMPQRGKIINGREYSKHALERMAPKTPQVKAELEQRALVNGLKRGTKAFEKYVDPRGVPPMVVEDAIQNGTRLPGNMPGTWEHITNDVKVITNDAGKVITIYPK
ncbi:RHS repeat-associated core domain-containing protein [Clostridium aciditolerans]|uniref:RHS repeat-associated core domain-containing protein n=2 Tax=Clostridium aciditolerans TaxID=339861 RepID=A0A934HP86_9CLOT|nr:RHS repeat-associated core domain-containing protein [Clostridium aciditolerans]